MAALISSGAVEEGLPVCACRCGVFLELLRGASRLMPTVAVLFLLVALSVGSAALGATPVGSQFQVNTYTTREQSTPAVAADADGDFVVVWISFGSAGSDTLGPSIQGQRYDAGGSAVGSEFQVNTYTTHYQFDPSVAVDADGDFVVVWGSNGSAGSDSDYSSIQGQRYDSSGNPIGSEFQVNTYTTNYQYDPSVAVDADGDFVVVWGSNGSAGSDAAARSVQGQRYDSSGNPIGSQFQVNTYTTGDQRRPSVAADADGGFVVVWESYGSADSDTSYRSVQGQRYDAGGSAVGSEFQVNTYTTGDQRRPSVAADADGGFVVVWGSSGSAGGDSFGSIQGQRYDAGGSAVGSEFQVNTYTTNSQGTPSVASGPGGDFVVVWESSGSAGGDTSGTSIQGQRYDSSGNPIGSEFQVNTYTTGLQVWPSVASGPGGDFVVVWGSNGSAGSDSDSTSVQGQRYTVRAPQVPSVALRGLIGLAVLLLGIAAVALRGRFRQRV